ncbi:GNAT family N-acetyltransferase [Paenibacillus mesophilus]|uniref:GNAT family N-acetyltransferase n=1 Tax=Paenibacillus mesophilus TaxID=2582849 RepID=UPI00110F0197|nr:GNAT family N-acetyltransferase [Paenibacillus mesophilus]TMV49959.1 GNAT family N-acetyltransferase [Paenibacillus mesophilus]
MAIVCDVVTDVRIMKEIVLLQKEVWGAESVTSMPQMIAAIHHGGAVIAAFDEGKVVGFCYGFPGHSAGKTYLFSHMMAIHPDYRDEGLGQSLKERQRLWAIAYGYDKIAWTFDPLETRNAHLNLNKLGGIVKVYLTNYYGELNDSMAGSFPSDRFLVEWELYSPRSEIAIKHGITADETIWSAYDFLFEWQLEGAFPRPCPATFHPTADAYLVPVPNSIRDMKQSAPELAKTWRFELRRQLTQSFAQGYCVVGLWRTEQPVHYYVLEKKQFE